MHYAIGRAADAEQIERTFISEQFSFFLRGNIWVSIEANLHNLIAFNYGLNYALNN